MDTTRDMHENVTLVRSFFDAFARGDLEAVLDAFAEDGLYRVSGDNSLSGTYRGREEIRDVMVELGTLTGGSVRLTVDDVIGGDGHAVMFGRMTAERGSKSFSSHGIVAFKVDQGRFTETWFLLADQRAYDEFFRT